VIRPGAYRTHSKIFDEDKWNSESKRVKIDGWKTKCPPQERETF
jgi:hypothetical protein